MANPNVRRLLGGANARTRHEAKPYCHKLLRKESELAVECPGPVPGPLEGRDFISVAIEGESPADYLQALAKGIASSAGPNGAPAETDGELVIWDDSAGSFHFVADYNYASPQDDLPLEERWEELGRSEDGRIAYYRSRERAGLLSVEEWRPGVKILDTRHEPHGELTLSRVIALFKQPAIRPEEGGA